MSTVTIALLHHRELPVAARIHGIQMEAYAQEAVLLGVTSFPPLERTLDDVQRSGERFLGAHIDRQLVGIAAIEAGAGAGETSISSLVVLPSHQRRGVARALVSAIIAASVGGAITVSTGAANHPALALYAGLGFVEHGRRHVGEPPLEIILLRAPAAQATTAGS
jgi:ribosomal protein S18 acetylase RimI-like enzyme